MITRPVADKRDAIVGAWMGEACAGIGAPALGLGRDHDRFACAESRTLSNCLPVLFDEIVGSMDRVRVAAALDDILRIRAVQPIAPSCALGFILGLRRIIREKVGSGPDSAAFLAFVDDRIDQLALQAFDSLVECREQIARARLEEVGRGRVILGRMRLPVLEEPGDVP
ncbi:MAG: RsbRD N-terminal domain-containing protein [Vicinamibacterales bacterium]